MSDAVVRREKDAETSCYQPPGDYMAWLCPRPMPIGCERCSLGRDRHKWSNGRAEAAAAAAAAATSTV